MNYFENCKTAEEIKKQYWKLCRKFHPDMNPDSDTETMAEINNQYEKAMKTKTTEHGEGKFMKIVNRLAKYQGITIEIIGEWVWVSGNVGRCLLVMEKMGFVYSRSRKMYYWNGNDSKKKTASRMSMDQIKDKYGCKTVKNSPLKEIA